MTAQTPHLIAQAAEVEPVSELTIDEATGTLTGYEEIGIERHFGKPWMTLAEAEPMTLVRALIFTIGTREGANAPEAKDQAMRMTLAEVMAYFTPDEDDRDPLEEEESDSEQGKGNAVPA